MTDNVGERGKRELAVEAQGELGFYGKAKSHSETHVGKDNGERR